MAANVNVIPSLKPCAICEAPASAACTRCGRPLCARHLVVRQKKEWVRRTVSGIAGDVWTAYVPTGTWTLCPACAPVVAREDAREEARDRHLLRRRRLVLLAIVVLVVGGRFALSLWAGR